ncbi:unnamed protein product [Brassica oleracea]|uniref:Uncharacterized protein n=1 Tax=Brassica oleracea TaxID=3712 RepID=A0A3P6FCS0_BRAOL|nr:unnamed protein product [Brassica oleracea]
MQLQMPPKRQSPMSIAQSIHGCLTQDHHSTPQRTIISWKIMLRKITESWYWRYQPEDVRRTCVEDYECQTCAKVDVKSDLTWRVKKGSMVVARGHKRGTLYMTMSYQHTVAVVENVMEMLFGEFGTFGDGLETRNVILKTSSQLSQRPNATAKCSGQDKPLEKSTTLCPISGRCSEQTTRNMPLECAAAFCSGQMTCQKPAAALRKICTSVFTNFFPKLSWVNPCLLGRPSSVLGHYKYFLDLILGLILFSI